MIAQTEATGVGAAGSAPTCVRLVSRTDGIASCGAPAVFRCSLGRTYCLPCGDEVQRASSVGILMHRIQPDRPDPSGVALLMRVVRHHLQWRVTRTILGQAWENALNVMRETAGAAVELPVGIVVSMLAVLWVLACLPAELIRSLYATSRRPDDARKAFRIVDGLPPNAQRERPAEGGGR